MLVVVGGGLAGVDCFIWLLGLCLRLIVLLSLYL